MGEAGKVWGLQKSETAINTESAIQERRVCIYGYSVDKECRMKASKNQKLIYCHMEGLA
jgi:hypothetical protein